MQRLRVWLHNSIMLHSMHYVDELSLEQHRKAAVALIWSSRNLGTAHINAHMMRVRTGLEGEWNALVCFSNWKSCHL